LIRNERHALIVVGPRLLRRAAAGENTSIDPEQFMKTKFDDTKQGNIISR